MPTGTRSRSLTKNENIYYSDIALRLCVCVCCYVSKGQTVYNGIGSKLLYLRLFLPSWI